jgi:hypothetical protein
MSSNQNIIKSKYFLHIEFNDYKCYYRTSGLKDRKLKRRFFQNRWVKFR